MDAGPHRPRRRRHQEEASALLQLRRAGPRPGGGRPGVQRRGRRAGAGQLPRLPRDRAARRTGRPYGVFTRRVRAGTTTSPHVAVLPDGTRVTDRAPAPTDARQPAARRTSRLSPPASPEPCRRARPAGCRWARSPGPAAATRAATPTSASGCAPTRRGAWLAHALTVDAAARAAARDAPSCRSPARAAQPAGGQLRRRRAARRGRRRAATRFDPQAKALGEWLRSRARRHPGGAVL